MAMQAAKAPTAQRSGFSIFVRTHALQIGITVVAILLWGVFAFFAPTTFFNKNIYQAFMSTTPFFAIVALPLTMVVILGDIDLSFPSIMSWGVLVFSWTLVATGNLWIAFILCLVAGFLAGMLNGAIIVRFGVPSLVVTIGTSFFWRGVVQVLTDGHGTSLLPTRGTFFYELMVGRLFGFIPMQMVWTVVIAVLSWVFLNRHRFGAHVYLIGDNQESARLMGINVGSRKRMAFAIVGMAAAFAGLIASLEVTYYWPTLGEGYLLNTLSSVFLGGTSVFGGVGTIYGTFVASFIVGAINAGIVAVGLSGFWTQLIYGLIVVGAVVIQTVVSKRVQ
ncbi:MAG: ABC transporter permease [Anaerolineales bacterium]|nr:ABC transporter permease [Anaerolineales bacterium]